MFDIGWSELLLIGIVALIVVGPKDLPGMFRTLGRFTAKARAMGREFQRAMDDAARETGVKETADDLRAMTSKKNLGLDALEQAATKFEKWEPAKPSTTPKGPATQALADKKAAEAAARKAAAKPVEPEAPVTRAATANARTSAKPKAPAKPKVAAKPKAAAKPKSAAKPKAAAARKPKAKKGEA
ncbi:Sec-independent protein translocase protein TatB [Defluviimonas aquaemixtae]|uniref:Sec-independent protein translocase protein TatB n=1 Tax=Albidovulum aquaemixtae TaxID=1542388 RepID=A0A2R8B3Y8_9RHOB|nr:Sec-independent protein translocase protein TatB [Defluviimonas aquaemixtae]SPH17361.1 Sec-independent protein translocase protein TatB [Defluviimonas aquaemixtae]